MIIDPSEEELSTQSKKIAHDIRLNIRYLEDSTQWVNLANNYISILKETVRHDLLESNEPHWSYEITALNGGL